MKREISGNTNGLKKSVLLRLENLYDVKSEPSVICDYQILVEICELTENINREIAVYISGRGKTEYVGVGDFRTVALKSGSIGKNTRCIHTHPSEDGRLSSLDIDSLKKTGVSVMAAVGVREGKPNGIYCAYIDEEGEPVYSGPYFNIEDTRRLISEVAEFNSKSYEIEYANERVIAAGVNTPNSKALLDELEDLIVSAGGECVFKIEQTREKFDSAYYMGKGKIDELRHHCSLHNASTIVFDDSLSPGQIRNIEKHLNVKILDRSSLILDIFAQRAHSKDGKIQVELAQLNYLLPRLVGRGTELSRLAGGIGTRGPGESKLETDRRHILRRITHLKKDLKKVSERREVLRENRKKGNVFTVAIAGYTNSGKSTLLNKMTNSKVGAEDILFATLDPSARKLELPSGENIVMVDTVGFISKLPHELVEAFKSTLEEVSGADMVLHVMDGSNSDMERQKEIVYEIMNELNAGGLPVIEVINKKDIALKENLRMKSKRENVRISALTGEGIDELIKKIEVIAEGLRIIKSFDVPYTMGKLISYIHGSTEILEKKYNENSIHFKLRLTKKSLSKIANCIEGTPLIQSK